MKSFYYISVFFAMLFASSIAAQTGSQMNDQETVNAQEIEKILEQYKQNQLLDNDLPPGWEFSVTGSVHIISLFPSVSPDFCGIPLQTGDYIGLFYVDTDGQEKCGGFVEWVDTTSSIPIIAYGDDSFTPDIKEGFSFAEEFKWLAYLYSMGGKIKPISVPEYEAGYASDNKFRGTNNGPGLSIIKEVLKVVNGNDIVIPAGWSGLSSFTETTTWPPLIANVMEPISDDLIILQDMNKIYFPGQGINTMFIWTDAHGYKIKLSEEAVFPMPGCPPSDLSIDLDATWNICPVISECNVMVTELFNPIIDKLIVIKEIGGNKIYWPAMGIQTLQVFEPGRAYYVAVSQNTSITYGDCQSYKSHPEPVESILINHTPWITPAETGSSHTIAFPAEVLQNLNTGDYIAAFNATGTCAGLTQIENPSEPLPLTVYGDDLTTQEPEGLQDGEEMLFRVYNLQQNESMDVQISFDGNYAHDDGSFADNGLSVVSSLKLSSTGLSDLDDAVIEIFPNPAGSQVNVRMKNNETYLLSLQHINGGQILNKSFTNEVTLDVGGLSRGVYFVEIIGQNTKSIHKLVLK